MKVLDLLEEIEEIVDTASGFPLTGKIMVDANELLAIVNEIRDALPNEIQQAQWIKNERDRILGNAKVEYDTIIKDANEQAEMLIDDNEIMKKSRTRAAALTEATEANIREMKMSAYDYIDGILFDFQEKMDELSATYFEDMFGKLETTFNEVNATLSENREEIKEMAYRTSVDIDGEAPAGEPAPEEEPEEENYYEDDEQ